MLLEAIKQLTAQDFEDRNDEIWAAIQQLPAATVEALAESQHWNDDEIIDGLWQTAHEIKLKDLAKVLKAKLAPDELRLFCGVVCDEGINLVDLQNIVEDLLN